MRRGGGRGREGVCRVVGADRPARNVRGTSRVAPAGGSPARSVRRRSRGGRGGLRVGWWSSGGRPCLRACITAPAWACTRNKNGVGAAVVLASGGYGWDKDRNRNWRCTATGGIAGGGGSGPGHVDRFASKASGWSCASWPACLLLLRRPGGRGGRGVWGAGPLQARGFGGGAPPPCCPPPPDFIPYNVQL